MVDQKKRFNRKRKGQVKRAQLNPNTPRLNVYRSNQFIYAQIIDDKTGNVLASANDIKSKKGNKTESAKNVGLSIAKAAKSAKVESVVFDRNGFAYHGRIEALANGAREGGLQF